MAVVGVIQSFDKCSSRIMTLNRTRTLSVTRGLLVEGAYVGNVYLVCPIVSESQ